MPNRYTDISEGGSIGIPGTGAKPSNRRFWAHISKLLVLALVPNCYTVISEWGSIFGSLALVPNHQTEDSECTYHCFKSWHLCQTNIPTFLKVNLLGSLAPVSNHQTKDSECIYQNFKSYHWFQTVIPWFLNGDLYLGPWHWCQTIKPKILSAYIIFLSPGTSSKPLYRDFWMGIYIRIPGTGAKPSNRRFLTHILFF